MNRVFQTFPILHFLLLLFSISVFPQQEKLQTENFTIDNGLSQNSINCIVQDNVGFIWIGTQNGLNRYDGYTFTKYNFNPEDKTSLSHNYINFILEDNSNQLWIGTAGGLNKYNRQLDSFTRYVSDPDNPNSLNSNLVMSIYEDSKDILWIGTDGGGLNKLNRNTNSFSAYTHNPEDSTTISSDRIFYAICEDKQGNLLIGTLGGGLNLFNRQTQQFTHYINNPNDSTSLSNDRIYTIYVDKSGNVWIGTDGGGLNKLISQKNDFEPPTFIRYNSIPNDNSSINGNRVYSILEDTEGNILVGTLDGGLNKYVRNQNCFIQYDIPLVQTIYKDRTDLIWIGTFGEGVYKLDTKKQPFKHYKNNPNDPLSLSNNSIWSFFEFNEKVIWVGTRDGLNIFKRENKDFIHFRNDVQNPSSLSDNTIYKIYKDRRGDMWIGTNNGLNKVIIDEKNSLPTSFVRYRHDPENQFSICGNVITYL
jgi:ligand-binding sensor domain-containing protein